ncbi:MAG: hypothetical protein HQK63_04020 [Desulfamplus sp.]|nr:hypothetical protein [Desulfamplus sp.]
MRLPELKSAITTLSKIEKFSLIQFIIYDLAKEEESLSMLKNGNEYPIWSPYNADDAAAILLNELDKIDIKESLCSR